MDKKKKIIIIIIVVSVLLLILVLNVFNTLNYPNKIKKYIINLGFESSDISNLYYKQSSEFNLEQYNNEVKNGNDSEYEVVYFNLDSYQFIKDKTTYSNDITKNLTSIFDYTNNSLKYIYRINFNNTNIIIEGSYDKKKEIFTCDPTFFFQINIDNSMEAICNKAEYEMKKFQNEADILFENPNFLEHMKKSNV